MRASELCHPPSADGESMISEVYTTDFDSIDCDNMNAIKHSEPGVPQRVYTRMFFRDDRKYADRNAGHVYMRGIHRRHDDEVLLNNADYVELAWHQHLIGPGGLSESRTLFISVVYGFGKL